MWLFVALNGFKVVEHIRTADQIISAYPGGFDMKILIAPFVLLIAELFLWFRFFRWQRHPAKLFAGIIGAYIWLMIIVVNSINADLYERDMPILLFCLYAYTGAGHLTYAFFGRD